MKRGVFISGRGDPARDGKSRFQNEKTRGTWLIKERYLTQGDLKPDLNKLSSQKERGEL